jgi:hypothetical protein
LGVKAHYGLAVEKPFPLPACKVDVASFLAMQSFVFNELITRNNISWKSTFPLRAIASKGNVTKANHKKE